MTAPQAILDVNVQNFTAEVLEYSQQTPVLVDFHAAWCGPCKTLGPILETLANEYAGGFRLAKIDIDQNPELAEAFGIQSVPAVILVQDGRPLDGFMGALPEPEIRKFLEKHAIGGAAADPFVALDELEAAGQADAAIDALDAWLEQEPDNGPARVRLARLLLEKDRAEDARAVFDRVPTDALTTEEARSVAKRLELSGVAGELDKLVAAVEEDPTNLARRIELGRAQVAAGQGAEGLETLLDVAKENLSFDDGAARKALLEMFEMLGSDNPLTLEFQQRLSVLLCV